MTELNAALRLIAAVPKLVTACKAAKDLLCHDGSSPLAREVHLQLLDALQAAGDWTTPPKKERHNAP